MSRTGTRLPGALAVLIAAISCASAQTFTLLHSFNGSNGATPWSGVVPDKKGNFYGTAATGGVANAGTVYKLTADGKLKMLYSFLAGVDGQFPYGALVRDDSGNLYGTTQDGGDSGDGTIYTVSSTGTEKILFNFTGPDGAHPWAGLIRDKDGNLYGTTLNGGHAGAGTIFKLDPSGTESLLYSFTFKKDGGLPYSGLVVDKKGNLYGTTSSGNTFSGTAFKLTAARKMKVLHTFSDSGDGETPYAGLVRDSGGNLYGTTFEGGAFGFGSVFRLSPSGAETLLYSFTGGADGNGPFVGSLVRDAAGTLYGTTKQGGAADQGTVFKLSPDGIEIVLHSFTGTAQDGAYPYGTLLRDKAGNLYGTTVLGGASNLGTIYKIAP